MNIALSCDDKFAIPALIAITSIFENNKNEDCKVILMTQGLSEENKSKFLQLGQTYNRVIDIRVIDNKELNKIKLSGRFPLASYFRLMLPAILPNDDKVLYLDCDVIVDKSLDKLYNTDISNYSIAAVVDQGFDVPNQNRLKLVSPYINSGVLLINLKYWREHNTAKCIIDFAIECSEMLQYADQDAINKTLEGSICYLDYECNFQELWTKRDLTYTPIHFSKWEQIKAAMGRAIIIHYCSNIKPWHKECTNPLQDKFLKYAKMHEFIGFKLKYAHNPIIYYFVKKIRHKG